MFSITERPRAEVSPSGHPNPARRWFSNCDVTAPSMVQWPELCTRGATSLATSSPSRSKSSTAITPTYSSSSMTAAQISSARRWRAASTRGAGAMESRSTDPSWWFSVRG